MPPGALPPPAQHRGRALVAAASLSLAAVLGPLAVAGQATAQGSPTSGRATSAEAAAATAGLYGEQDPRLDGVQRQSLALLALAAVGIDPPAAALATLREQQCPDGAWQSWRSDPAQPCDPGSEDVVASAYATQALAALGAPAVVPPLRWLRWVQNDDGGFPLLPGGPTDTRATAAVIGAVIALGGAPQGDAWRAGSSTPYTALASFLRPCDDSAAAGAVAGPDGLLDPTATAAVAMGLIGQPLPLVASRTGRTVARTACTLVSTSGPEGRSTAATNAAAALVPGILASDPPAPDALPAADARRADLEVALAVVATGVMAPGTLAAATSTDSADPRAAVTDRLGRDRADLLALEALLTTAVDPDGSAGWVARLEATRGTAATPRDVVASRPVPGVGEPAVAPTTYWLLAGLLAVVAGVGGARVGRDLRRGDAVDRARARAARAERSRR